MTIARARLEPRRELTRRQLLGLSAGALASAGSGLLATACRPSARAATFVARTPDYGGDIAALLGTGLAELGISAAEVAGTSVLLKPNLVETGRDRDHINTHPLVVRGAVEAFLSLGAARVLVAEGAGHRRDAHLVLEESGMAEVLAEDRIPFVDLNYDRGVPVRNRGGLTGLRTLTFPRTVREVDWVVSMPKLKTHHWVGVTLSMKNLFGVMPGIYYGWPKNVLHQHGIVSSILDINATLPTHLAIVDAVVGMEGDGPIMGTPRHVGALVVGRNFPAVDATCARIMGLRPERIPYLAAATPLGPIARRQIEQRGEKIRDLATDFELVDSIPAHRGLR